MKSAITLFALLSLLSLLATAEGNSSNKSFNKAKKLLEREVYFDHRETIYCNAAFDENKNVITPEGFTTTKHVKRARRIEWEHVVPAENFGRTFSEWSDGHADCVNSKGNNFKGRNCASKVNAEYRYMQSDMYNLFPTIGTVNAMRSNYNFVERLDDGYSFGNCNVVIGSQKAQPTTESKGRIARAYLYMQEAYPRYKMGKPQAKLMQAWDKQYPTSEWECLRYKRIKAIQQNENDIMKSRCTD
jgi:deoxyribonuclease-1